MYQNPILQHNLKLLQKYGYEIIEPESGMLACGYEGMGRLRSVEDIVDQLTSHTDKENLLLKGKRVLITAGGTMEAIDPVRYLGNRSSGKMGIAFAEACRDQGATVTLVYSQVKAHLPKGVRLLHAESAESMLSLLQSEIDNHQLLIMAAAVGDYRVESQSKTKIKKGSQPLTLRLIENPDILKTLSQSKKKNQLFVGFAAETDHHLENATKKLKSKSLDMIVLNDVSQKDIGFNSNENAVTLLFSADDKLDIPRQSKYDISRHIIQVIHKRFYDN
ncbi:MAG: bifunctional phosphopantothenoylcysteine decarboxylase/phosphopantothenate--cysteine ligase CoaBC, partial [Spirochaetota bacterium]|nr:bifunctional phosphopantothenoylcysteine decarboxylase/phosphopantothenate--cysteine ligase CoaBC [Spirochaetota bacterium]